MKEFKPYVILFFISLLLLSFIIYSKSWKVQLMYNSLGTSIYTPESFSVRTGKESSLNEKIVKGRNLAKNKRIIITGLLRDSSKNIKYIRKKIEKIGSAFKDYKVIIVENNSSDDTREKLLEWKNLSNKVTILGCGINAKKCNLTGILSKKSEGHSVYRKRIEKMVNLRNIYLDYIRNNKELHNYNYTIVWDLDTISITYLDGIFTSIYELHNRNISAICALGVYRWLGVMPLYYDTYAHIDYGDNFHIDSKLKHDIQKGIQKGLEYKRGDDLVRVKSCFSGFTIYKTKDLLNIKYTMTPSKNNLECEHVRLNKKLPNGIYLNPSMINFVLYNK